MIDVIKACAQHKATHSLHMAAPFEPVYDAQPKETLKQKWVKICYIWIMHCVIFLMTITSLAHFYMILWLLVVYKHTPKTDSNIPTIFLSAAGVVRFMSGVPWGVLGVDGAATGIIVGGKGGKYPDALGDVGDCVPWWRVDEVVARLVWHCWSRHNIGSWRRLFGFEGCLDILPVG